MPNLQSRRCHTGEKGLENKSGSVSGEVRVTDPVTGGQKGTKLARFGLLPFDSLWEVAEVYGLGAKKYAERNWQRGYKWSLSFDALQRHLALWWEGEETDSESGLSHLAHAAFHILALIWFRKHAKGTDDRYVVTANSSGQEVSVPGEVRQD